MRAAFLDHVGIAVKPGSRLAEALATLGLPATGRESVEHEKVHSTWIPLPAAAGHVELLEPTEPSSLIQAFLDKSGRDAIHHLSFRVLDIRLVSEALKAKGFRLVYSEARPGARDCLVNFLHPKSTGGVLLEITQLRQKKTEPMVQ